jgi:hypothetical protein
LALDTNRLEKMAVVPEHRLKISRKLEILHCLLSGKPTKSLLEEFDAQELIEAKQFFWEKTVEFAIKAKGNNFSRDEISRRMKPLAWYQKEKGCKEPIQKCRGTECFATNPDCAFAKTKDQIEAMCSIVREYLNISREPEE